MLGGGPTIRISRPHKPLYFPHLAGVGGDLGEVMRGANLYSPTSASTTGHDRRRPTGTSWRGSAGAACHPDGCCRIRRGTPEQDSLRTLPVQDRHAGCVNGGLRRFATAQIPDHGIGIHLLGLLPACGRPVQKAGTVPDMRDDRRGQRRASRPVTSQAAGRSRRTRPVIARNARAGTTPWDGRAWCRRKKRHRGQKPARWV